MIIYKYYDNKIKIITKLEKIISEININYIFFYKIIKFQNLKYILIHTLIIILGI